MNRAWVSIGRGIGRGFGHSLGRGLGHWAERGVSLLLPPQCPVCRTLAFATLGEAGPQGACLGCMLRPPGFRRARGALRYDEAARGLVLPFKHADRTELAPVLGAMMARAGALLLADADALLPVPLHRRRLTTRRYNQAGLLTACIARRAGRPWLPDALMRHRETPPLGELSAAARADAVTGAFQVRPARRAAIAGRRLLLIDDVLTSGATASACAAVLLAAGAASVDVLVAARVPAPGGER
jgi:ComF family protein